MTDPSKKEDGVTVRIPARWLDRALQAVTLSAVVGFGGIWSANTEEQSVTMISMVDAVKANTGRLRALADELARNRAAQVAADRVAAQLAARIATLEAAR